MNNYNYFNPTRIIFGSNTEVSLPTEIKNYGKKVLLHYGGGSIKRFGLYDTIVKLLNENSIEFIELNGVKPNPVLSLVRDGIELCKNNNIDFIQLMTKNN
jgi:alcohol dehydrogenase YqhD (iron-dependent ADH family)